MKGFKNFKQFLYIIWEILKEVFKLIGNLRKYF